MSARLNRCLVIDDERMNREVLVANLRAAGYDTLTAEDGEQGWQALEDAPEGFDVILLDRRMPRLDGMGFLNRIKQDERLRHIPVIMQTAFASTEDVAEGIKAGVYYYLAKPLDRSLLLSVTQAAIEENRRYLRLREDLNRRSTAMTLMEQGAFSFRTLDEANTLAVSLARSCPNSQHLVVGLSEIFTNAVEHGNLGITFEEKTDLLNTGRWRQEIEERLQRPPYANRRAVMSFLRTDSEVRITVQDQGKGFNWRAYQNLDASRAYAAHGRGIAMARSLSFDQVIYNDIGNQVTCVIKSDGRGSGWQMAPCSPTSEWQPPTGPAAPTETNAALPALPSSEISNTAHNAGQTRALLRQMEDARQLQEGLLPDAQAITGLEERFGLCLSTIFETSYHLSGDLWGARALQSSIGAEETSDTAMAVWLADFSGHGIGAAMNTFRLHTLMSAHHVDERDPAQFMTHLNQCLAGLLPVGQYCTMIYAVLEPGQNRIIYSAAASPHPLVALKDGSVVTGDGSGLPLGVSQRAKYVNRTLPFAPDALFFMASDALTETADENGQFISAERLHAMLSDAAQAGQTNADTILAPFLSRLKRPLRDDLTALVCVRKS